MRTDKDPAARTRLWQLIGIGVFALVAIGVYFVAESSGDTQAVAEPPTLAPSVSSPGAAGSPPAPTGSPAPQVTDFFEGTEIPYPPDALGFEQKAAEELEGPSREATFAFTKLGDDPAVSQVEITNFYQNAFPLAGWQVIGFGGPGAARRQVWKKDGTQVSVYSSTDGSEYVWVWVNVCPPEPKKRCEL